MDFFKWVWCKVKVVSRPWASEGHWSLIRPLKWGTNCIQTPSGSKLAGRQSLKYRKRVCLSKESLLKRIFSPYFKLWRPASLEPMGVRRHYVSHFKGLISDQRPSEVRGRDTTFTLFNALLKKAILHYKRAIICRVLSMAVCSISHELIYTTYPSLLALT